MFISIPAGLSCTNTRRKEDKKIKQLKVGDAKDMSLLREALLEMGVSKTSDSKQMLIDEVAHA